MAGVLTEDNTLDHRSYERQGKEQIPTVHLGVAATQMERKGIRTERGDMNRKIEISNKKLRQLRARINHLKDWLKDEKETAPPTLADVLNEILSNGENKNRYRQIADLKLAAKMLIFIQQHNVTNITELRGAVGDFYGRQLALGDRLKPIERRIKTLDEHLRQSENFKANRKIAGQYNALNAEAKTAEKVTGLFAKSKAEKAHNTSHSFYEIHRAEITLYEAAKRYLKDVLQGRFDPKKLPPITKWQDERTAKTAEKQKLNGEYHALKDEIREVEIIRKYAEEIQRAMNPPQKVKSWEMEI
jgi:hypothetical protein